MGEQVPDYVSPFIQALSVWQQIQAAERASQRVDSRERQRIESEERRHESRLAKEAELKNRELGIMETTAAKNFEINDRQSRAYENLTGAQTNEAKARTAAQEQMNKLNEELMPATKAAQSARLAYEKAAVELKGKMDQVSFTNWEKKMTRLDQIREAAEQKVAEIQARRMETTQYQLGAALPVAFNATKKAEIDSALARTVIDARRDQVLHYKNILDSGGYETQYLGADAGKRAALDYLDRLKGLPPDATKPLPSEAIHAGILRASKLGSSLPTYYKDNVLGASGETRQAALDDLTRQRASANGKNGIQAAKDSPITGVPSRVITGLRTDAGVVSDILSGGNEAASKQYQAYRNEFINTVKQGLQPQGGGTLDLLASTAEATVNNLPGMGLAKRVGEAVGGLLPAGESPATATVPTGNPVLDDLNLLAAEDPKVTQRRSSAWLHGTFTALANDPLYRDSVEVPRMVLAERKSSERLGELVTKYMPNFDATAGSHADKMKMSLYNLNLGNEIKKSLAPLYKSMYESGGYQSLSKPDQARVDFWNSVFGPNRDAAKQLVGVLYQTTYDKDTGGRWAWDSNKVNAALSSFAKQSPDSIWDDNLEVKPTGREIEIGGLKFPEYDYTGKLSPEALKKSQDAFIDAIKLSGIDNAITGPEQPSAYHQALLRNAQPAKDANGNPIQPTNSLDDWAPGLSGAIATQGAEDSNLLKTLATSSATSGLENELGDLWNEYGTLSGSPMPKDPTDLSGMYTAPKLPDAQTVAGPSAPPPTPPSLVGQPAKVGS